MRAKIRAGGCCENRIPGSTVDQRRTDGVLTPEEGKAALKEKKGMVYEVKTSFSWGRNDFGGALVAFASTGLLQADMAGADSARTLSTGDR